MVGLVMLALVMPVQAAVDDPTRPPGLNSAPRVTSSSTKGPRWVLKSTLVSAERKTAVINNRVVGIGDRVRGATVVQIEPFKVRLRSGGSEVTLLMLKKKVKTLSRQQTRK